MAIKIDPITIAALQLNPQTPVEGCLNGTTYTAKIAIPDYGTRIERHYGQRLSALDIDFPFRHFGLSIAFKTPVEIVVHDDERRLDEGARTLLHCFGPLTLRNAYLPKCARTYAQRNVFPSLSFHVDRGSTQDDSISLFWRDPFDPVQRQPRSSSTLVLANAAAYLQAVKEGHGEHKLKLLYQLFKEQNIDPLFDEVMVKLGWCQPEGVGEIALIDNRTVLHASYYAQPEHKGYPITVRYLF